VKRRLLNLLLILSLALWLVTAANCVVGSYLRGPLWTHEWLGAPKSFQFQNWGTSFSFRHSDGWPDPSGYGRRRAT
jgi:hypothetical protein